MHMSKVTKVM